MKVKTQIILLTTLAIKLLILLYINSVADLGLFTHLVLMPVLLLESLAIYGYLYECSFDRKVKRKAKIAGRIKHHKKPLEVKPAA